ncbi:hypothetical protein AB5I41_28390 [Sphingomonas sp. MMS24-JH45]
MSSRALASPQHRARVIGGSAGLGSSGRSDAPCFLLAALLLLAAVPVAAQVGTYPTATQSDADRLAAAIRRVGAAPRDLNALIEAGELSVKVGDATAAAALFKRAEQIDPNNGRVKAGIARILVNGEHPGGVARSLLAERAGLVMTGYAADRGLAYDLIGEQEARSATIASRCGRATTRRSAAATGAVARHRRQQAGGAGGDRRPAAQERPRRLVRARLHPGDERRRRGCEPDRDRA